MNSTAIYMAIEAIAKVSAKNAKQELLALHLADPQFKDVIVRSLDPFTTYGIARKFNVEPNGSNADFDAGTYGLLDDLARRSLTGNNAKDALTGELARLNPASAELLWRIIKKDLRAGFGDSSVNKVAKGTIATFPYQRCSLPKDTKLKEWDWVGGIISQEKADGMYCNTNHEESGVVELRTRQGNLLPVEKFPEIEWEIRNRILPGSQNHGELLVEVDGVVAPRQIGNGILNRIIDGGDFATNERPILKVWDQIPLHAVVPKGKWEVGYGARLSGILAQLKKPLPEVRPAEIPYFGDKPAISLIDTRIVYSLKEAFQHYIEYLRQGKEGTVIKKRTAIWKDGTSKEQIKLKLEVPVELEVYGYEEGNGKNAELFGSLCCRSADDLLRVNVSGFTDAMRKHIWENIDEWTAGGKIITVLSNSIMEISASNERCSLFLPRFTEERKDKTTANTLAEIRNEFANAIEKLEDLEA